MTKKMKEQLTISTIIIWDKTMKLFQLNKDIFMPIEIVSILEKEPTKIEKAKAHRIINLTSNKNLQEKVKGCIQMLMDNNILGNGFKDKCRDMGNFFGTKGKLGMKENSKRGNFMGEEHSIMEVLI